MAANIVGSYMASGQKVLRKSQRSTEVDGLVTLTETYTIRTSDIATLEPDRNTLHSAFSSDIVKYTRMAVETTRVEPMDGDLSSLVVNYVGLDYISGLPPAFITTVGQPGVGVFGADAIVVVKYITQESLFDTLKGGNVGINLGGTNLTLPTKRLLPSSINSTLMPPNPRQREYRRSKTASEQITAAQEAFNRYNQNNQTNNIVNVSSPILRNFAAQYEWIYAGYVQTGISFQRRGLFNQIEEQFSEYFRASDIFYQTDGTINFSRVNSFSDINFTF
jgi:hypothetical protein